MIINKRAKMKIPQDKKQHFLAGFAITAITSIFFGYIVGVVVAILASAGKEIYDKVTGKGTPELLDFVATVVGSVAAVATSVAVSWIWRVVAT